MFQRSSPALSHKLFLSVFLSLPFWVSTSSMPLIYTSLEVKLHSGFPVVYIFSLAIAAALAFLASWAVSFFSFFTFPLLSFWNNYYWSCINCFCSFYCQVQPPSLPFFRCHYRWSVLKQHSGRFLLLFLLPMQNFSPQFIIQR